MFNYKMSYSQADLDNHANQLNPDHDEYWHCREQPAHYADSSDEDHYSSDEDGFVRRARRVIRPTLHIIDPKSVRWGVEYDENTRCGYPDDRVAPCPPQEIIDESATTIQEWWQCVKKYPEKNICNDRMGEALQTLHGIRKNKAKISKIKKMLESLHLETSQLEEKFVHELESRETYPFREACGDWEWHRLVSLPQEGIVAWGERLIKEWSLRRYRYSNGEWVNQVWRVNAGDCDDYEPYYKRYRRMYGDGWHLKYLKTKHTCMSLEGNS